MTNTSTNDAPHPRSIVRCAIVVYNRKLSSRMRDNAVLKSCAITSNASFFISRRVVVHEQTVRGVTHNSVTHDWVHWQCPKMNLAEFFTFKQVPFHVLDSGLRLRARLFPSAGIRRL